MKIALAILLVLFASILSAQTIYKWKDEKGQWHFSQTPPPNAQGVEKRSMPMPMALELPKEAPCSSFELGEIRRFKAYRPSDDFPLLQMTDFSMQLLEANRSHYVFSWKLSVKNNSTDREAVSGTVKLLDCYDFPITEQQIAAVAIRPGEEHGFGDRVVISMPTALKVGRFSASYGGVKSARSADKETRPDPYRKPDVRVYYTQLQDLGDGIYFVGEVHNVGSATARNVKVSFSITNDRAMDVGKDTAEVAPSELRPGQTGMFRKRVLFLTTNRGYGWYSKAESSE